MLVALRRQHRPTSWPRPLITALVVFRSWLHRDIVDDALLRIPHDLGHVLLPVQHDLGSRVLLPAVLWPFWSRSAAGTVLLAAIQLHPQRVVVLPENNPQR